MNPGDNPPDENEPSEPDWDLERKARLERAVEDCDTCFRRCCKKHRTHVNPHRGCILR